jgi:hypothetical protein
MSTAQTSETHAELYACKLRQTAEILRLSGEVRRLTAQVRQWRERYEAATHRHVRRAHA